MRPMEPKRHQPPAQKRRHHHHGVYVVELADPVWNEASFRKANPDHQLGKPFVYVGIFGIVHVISGNFFLALIRDQQYKTVFAETVNLG